MPAFTRNWGFLALELLLIQASHELRSWGFQRSHFVYVKFCGLEFSVTLFNKSSLLFCKHYKKLKILGSGKTRVQEKGYLWWVWLCLSILSDFTLNGHFCAKCSFTSFLLCLGHLTSTLRGLIFSPTGRVELGRLKFLWSPRGMPCVLGSRGEIGSCLRTVTEPRFCGQLCLVNNVQRSMTLKL